MNMKFQIVPRLLGVQLNTGRSESCSHNKAFTSTMRMWKGVAFLKACDLVRCLGIDNETGNPEDFVGPNVCYDVDTDSGVETDSDFERMGSMTLPNGFLSF